MEKEGRRNFSSLPSINQMNYLSSDVEVQVYWTKLSKELKVWVQSKIKQGPRGTAGWHPCCSALLLSKGRLTTSPSGSSRPDSPLSSPSTDSYLMWFFSIQSVWDNVNSATIWCRYSTDVCVASLFEDANPSRPGLEQCMEWSEPIWVQSHPYRLWGGVTGLGYPKPTSPREQVGVVRSQASEMWVKQHGQGGMQGSSSLPGPPSSAVSIHPEFPLWGTFHSFNALVFMTKPQSTELFTRRWHLAK